MAACEARKQGTDERFSSGEKMGTVLFFSIRKKGDGPIFLNMLEIILGKVG